MKTKCASGCLLNNFIIVIYNTSGLPLDDQANLYPASSQLQFVTYTHMSLILIFLQVIMEENATHMSLKLIFFEAVVEENSILHQME